MQGKSLNHALAMKKTIYVYIFADDADLLLEGGNVEQKMQKTVSTQETKDEIRQKNILSCKH